MSVPSGPAGRFTPGDFRVGQVFSRTWSVLSRNFPTFVLVSAPASLPSLLMPRLTPDNPSPNLGVTVIVFLLVLVLWAFVQAALLHAAFQAIRGHPIDLAASARIGLRRFFPIVGIAIVVPALAGFATLLLVFPGLMLFTAWFVPTPVCVLEQLGVVDSMERSRELTKGHRWKIFGMLLLLIITVIVPAIVSVIVGFGAAVVQVVLGVVVVPGVVVTRIVDLVWGAIWDAFFGILVVVTYLDLRVAKEGIDTDQIAAVFE